MTLKHGTFEQLKGRMCGSGSFNSLGKFNQELNKRRRMAVPVVIDTLQVLSGRPSYDNAVERLKCLHSDK